MTFRLSLCVAAVALCFVMPSQASAVAITGTSSGTFSNLTGCDDKGKDRECGITTSVNGEAQVRWPYLDNKQQIGYASSLTAVDVDIDTTTGANDVIIARLDWFNAATGSRITPDSLGVTWTLTIAFTNPNLSFDTEGFALTITNPNNPTGDTVGGFTLMDLGNLTFDLDGVTIDDFQYVVADGAGNCHGTDTYLTGASWYNCENNHASLLITADFTASPLDSGQGVINEPATFALFGTSLLGLVAVRRRKFASLR